MTYMKRWITIGLLLLVVLAFLSWNEIDGVLNPLPTPTNSPTPILTSTATSTATFTPTPTRSSTLTPTPTSTNTITPTPTNTTKPLPTWTLAKDGDGTNGGGPPGDGEGGIEN